MYSLNKMTSVWEESEEPLDSLKYRLFYFQATATFPLKITEAPRLSFGKILNVVLCLQDLHKPKQNSQGYPRPKGETPEPTRSQCSPQCISLTQPEEAGAVGGSWRVWEEAVQNRELLQTIWMMLVGANPGPSVISHIQQNYLERCKIGKLPEWWPICDWIIVLCLLHALLGSEIWACCRDVLQSGMAMVFFRQEIVISITVPLLNTASHILDQVFSKFNKPRHSLQGR